MIEDYLDIDISNLKYPSIEERKEHIKNVEIYFTLIYGIINNSINKCEEITISAKYFPSKEIFGSVMVKIGEAFSNNENIQIEYLKPEDKNPNSTTYKMVFPKFVVKNLSLIIENKKIKDEHKMAMNSISKDIKNNIIETVQKKYEKKEE